MSCPDCVRGSAHTDAGEAKGNEETLYGRKCYVASPPPTSTSTSVIVYITDSYGLNLINAKLLADRFAAETGCRVLVPDIIPGSGAPAVLMHHMEVMETSVALGDVRGQLRRAAAALAVGWYWVPLVLRVLTWSSPQTAFRKTVLPFARKVRAGLPPGAKMGVVGFCWGGYGSVNLCQEPAVQGGSDRLVDVQFCGHPYGLTAPRMVVDAVRKFKVPFSMAVGDHDRYLGREKVEETEAALTREFGSGEGDCKYEVKVYKGCTHGFVVRAMPGNEVETAAAEEARVQAVEWLRRYL